MPEIAQKPLTDVPKNLDKALWDFLDGVHHNLSLLGGFKGTIANKGVTFGDITVNVEPGIVQIVSVTDIDDPAPELATLSSGTNGDLLIAAQADEYTVYSWRAATVVADSPYVLTGRGGGWIAVAGKYIQNDTSMNDLTASRLVETSAAKKLSSVAILAAYIGGTDKEITVTAVAGGRVVLSRPDEVTDEKMTINQELMLSPSATVAITAAGGITATKPVMHVQGSGGPIDITANPQIAAGTAGQLLILEGKSDTNTITLDNGNGLLIHGRAILGDDDIIVLYMGSTAWEEITRNFPEKEISWGFESPAATTGDFYFAGFYDHGAAADDFNPGITHGVANCSNAAHFFLVQAAGAGGGTDTVVRITGTTIDDQGNRTAAVNVDITVDDDGSAGDYYETDEKFLGQVSVTKLSGPDLLCNYGFAKYWDNNNTNYKITGVEAVWLASANDPDANIIAVHHQATGWTYNAGAPADHSANIADMRADHVTEVNLVNNENGAWKRDNLNVSIGGGNGEGFILHIVTTKNKAFEQGTFLLRVRPA